MLLHTIFKCANGLKVNFRPPTMIIVQVYCSYCMHCHHGPNKRKVAPSLETMRLSFLCSGLCVLKVQCEEAGAPSTEKPVQAEGERAACM